MKTDETNTFLATLEDLSGGMLKDELHRSLSELVDMVRATNPKGSITLTLTVAPAKGSDLALSVDPAVTVKTPKVERESTVFFYDKDQVLTRNDPRQPKLPTMAPSPLRPAFSSGGGNT